MKKLLLTIITITILSITCFAQNEIPFWKQPDKQVHFGVVFTTLAPISYAAAFKLTDGNKLMAIVWSTIFVSAVAAGYELIHDKFFKLGHPSMGDFFAGMAGHFSFVLTATIVIPWQKK